MELCVCRQSLSSTFLSATWLVTCASPYFRVLLHDQHGYMYFTIFQGPSTWSTRYSLVISGLRWPPAGPRPKFEGLGRPLELIILERKIGLRLSFSGSGGPRPKFQVLGHPLKLIILERRIGLRLSFSGSDGPRPKFEVLGHPLERWFSGSICPQWAGHFFLKKTIYFTFHLFDQLIHAGQFSSRFYCILNLIWW